MGVFRSYFKKNNTLISNNLTNNSQNPVTEISYGTLNKQVSRFIFDIDLEPLKNRILQGFINPDTITKHILHMTNTISYAPQYVGRKSYSDNIYRTASFRLDLFNITEDWDEGSGYDFIYESMTLPTIQQASNWFERKTNVDWSEYGGGYITGQTEVVGSQQFQKGNEDLTIDITDYINNRIFYTGDTGQTGTTTYGLGLKFSDELEPLEDLLRHAVAFHAKGTNTFYEPYIETIFDNTIRDDRNYFYLDKDNDLYLYANIGGESEDVVISGVTIYDFEDREYGVISGDAITRVSKGVYKVTLNISSEEYPDAVNFRDVWEVYINGRRKMFESKFYLIKEDNYFNFDLSNEFELDNYHFYFWGIRDDEKIVAGDVKKVRLTVKELYPNQNNFIPLDIEYRVYTTVGSKYELDIIPFTPVNRMLNGYNFYLDTSWLIPQDYFLEIRLKNGSYHETKERISFSVVSNKLKL